MHLSGIFFLPSLPVATALAFASALSAQTLEHRAPAAPRPEANQSGPNRRIAASAKPILPTGTNLQVETLRHYPMKADEVIEARLLHPIFAEGRMAVPQDTMLHGKIVALGPDSKTRWHARLRGDFTPFHTVQVQFDELALPTGALAISTGRAENGAPVLRLAAPGASPHQPIVSRYWSHAKNQIHDRVAYFTAPGLGDRALEMLCHQLPYHPERIEAHTMWSFDLTEPLSVPDIPVETAKNLGASGEIGGDRPSGAKALVDSAGSVRGLKPPPPSESGTSAISASRSSPSSGPAQKPASPALTDPSKPETWSVHALLTGAVTSATAGAGDPVQALVVEPVFDREGQLVVPQGSVLVGRVSTASAARTLGRNGKLRFNFQQVSFPEGAGPAAPNRPVEGALAGATTESQRGLEMDAEGTITPKNQSSVIAPLLLTVLAGRALDEDGNLTAQTGVASNGFGFVGRFVGMAAGNRNIAAGIGYYAAALSVYENFLRPGRDVIFPKDTRIEIETTPLRAPVLKPESQ